MDEIAAGRQEKTRELLRAPQRTHFAALAENPRAKTELCGTSRREGTSRIPIASLFLRRRAERHLPVQPRFVAALVTLLAA